MLYKKKIKILTYSRVFRPVKEKINQEVRRQLNDSWIFNMNLIKSNNIKKCCHTWGVPEEMLLLYKYQLSGSTSIKS